MWEELSEAIESNFWSALRRQTDRWLRQRKDCFTSVGGVLLTSTRDVVRQWKEYSKNLLNHINTFSTEDVESVDSIITGAEVNEIVKKLYVGKALGMDEIRPEFLKTLVVLVDMSLQHCVDIGGSTFGLADWGGGYSF